MEFEKVHISQIGIGDAILHDGFLRTVGKSNIKHYSFMGKSLFGDSYKSGHNLVKRAVFKRWS